MASGSTLLVSALAVDEFCWALLKMHYRRQYRSAPPPRHFKDVPADLANFAPQVAAAARSLLALPNIEALPGAALSGSSWCDLAIDRFAFGALEPRDAFHLAAAEGAGADGLLTADEDFRRIGSGAAGGFSIFLP